MSRRGTVRTIHGYDTLYLWTIAEDYKLKKETIHKVAKKYGSDHDFRDENNRIRNFTDGDLEVFKNNRFLTINDYGYDDAKNIISKGLFKKMLKAQEAYNRANDKFIKFREVNG